MNKLPKARTADLVTQDVNGEILIYNLKTHKTYCLNKTSAIVFNACDGETSFAALKNKRGFTGDLIFLSLDQLQKENLLDETDEAYVSPFSGISRREVIKRVGLGTLIALPVISYLIAPTAAHAQSGCTSPGLTCLCPNTGSAATTSCTDASCDAGCLCNATCSSGASFCTGSCS